VIAALASPSETPGFKLYEIVTAGIWPMCDTVSGPTPLRSAATASSGTSCPDLLRMRTSESAAASRWYSGATSMTT